MKGNRIPRHWHALKPVNQIPDDQRCFDLESIQVDHVYGKSDKVVLPEFELEVVHEFLESQTGQDDDKSEDQDHSRSQSVVSKADSQGRVAQGAGLPAQVDAATLGSNLVKSVRGTQQGTSSSSTDLGILHVRFHPLSPNIKSSLDSTRSDNFARVAFIHYSTTTALEKHVYAGCSGAVDPMDCVLHHPHVSSNMLPTLCTCTIFTRRFLLFRIRLW